MLEVTVKQKAWAASYRTSITLPKNLSPKTRKEHQFLGLQPSLLKNSQRFGSGIMPIVWTSWDTHVYQTGHTGPMCAKLPYWPKWYTHKVSTLDCSATDVALRCWVPCAQQLTDWNITCFIITFIYSFQQYHWEIFLCWEVSLREREKSNVRSGWGMCVTLLLPPKEKIHSRLR